MFFCLINAVISAERPNYLTERTTTQYSRPGIPAWTIDFDLFEQVLLAKPTNGNKIKIVLPDYNAHYQEYEVESDPLFALATLKKYPDQLYAFRGNMVNNKEEGIGIVYCFRSLKVYYVNHHQTIEMDQSLNGITIYDSLRPTGSRSINEQKTYNEIIQEKLHNFCHVHREAGSELPDPSLLFNTDFDQYMDDIKVIKFIPFPTQTYSKRLNTDRGLSLSSVPAEDLKKNVFSSAALSVHYLNAIYLPVLSVRFEMQLDLNMITLDYDSTAAREKYVSLSSGKDYDIKNKVIEFASNFFDPNDIDCGVMFTYGVSEGLANLRVMTPGNELRCGSWVKDEFQTFGVFEVILAHEIGHLMGSDHTFTYKENYAIEATEVGSGVTIMAYPGRTVYDNVRNIHIPYFTWTSSKIMMTTILMNDQLKTLPKKNRKPVIQDMKTRYVIPTGTAFLLNGKATDPDGDVLYYLWEQTDMFAGIVNHDTYSPDLEAGPIIRNYEPTLESYRFVPRLDRIKTGQLTDSKPWPQAWETVPNVARTINMAFVVRDRKLLSGEAGNTAVQIVEITVVESDPFKIISYNTPTTLTRGAQADVNWNVGNTAGSQINTPTVTIKFASDGVNFYDVLAERVPNNGHAVVTMPSQFTNTGRIMIQGDDNIFITINTGDITLL